MEFSSGIMVPVRSQSPFFNGLLDARGGRTRCYNSHRQERRPLQVHCKWEMSAHGIRAVLKQTERKKTWLNEAEAL